ncbi:MAG TPA: DinB family protein [Chryseosolibacter sp.]|nr:DinB family protein [Chryseosolibacter sp.]
MTTDALSQLKFPIGPFIAPENVDGQQLDDLIKTIESAPAQYRRQTENLSHEQLQRTYRDGSWTVQQLVTHVADMQLLHYFRMRRTLTEDYKEVTLVNIDGWANSADAINTPVRDSLALLDAMTTRFVILMRSLTPAQQDIAYYHPIRKIMLTQKQAIAMSAWHVRHHLEHIRIALST